MHHNYQIKIEYDGTKFVGWQYQKHGISLQEILAPKYDGSGGGGPGGGLPSGGQSAPPSGTPIVAVKTAS